MIAKDGSLTLIADKTDFESAVGRFNELLAKCK